MPALLAALIALALTTPAEAAKKRPHSVCVQIWDPGVGPMRICAPKLR